MIVLFNHRFDTEVGLLPNIDLRLLTISFGTAPIDDITIVLKSTLYYTFHYFFLHLSFDKGDFMDIFEPSSK
jgi:hypothetical protein